MSLLPHITKNWLNRKARCSVKKPSNSWFTLHISKSLAMINCNFCSFLTSQTKVNKRLSGGFVRSVYISRPREKVSLDNDFPREQIANTNICSTLYLNLMREVSWLRDETCSLYILPLTRHFFPLKLEQFLFYNLSLTLSFLYVRC